MGTGLHTEERGMGHIQLSILIVDSRSASVDWSPVSGVGGGLMALGKENGIGLGQSGW